MAVEAGGIGARLRAGREKLGLTVLQVAERIHTDPKIVESIEAESYEALGAPVYARGHIRHYAELVGESANELIQMYSNVSKVAQPDLTRIVKAPAGPDSSKLVAPALVVIVVFAVAGAIWWVSALSKKKPQMSETHVVTDETPASPAASTRPADSSASPDGATADGAAGTAAPVGPSVSSAQGGGLPHVTSPPSSSAAQPRPAASVVLPRPAAETGAGSASRSAASGAGSTSAPPRTSANGPTAASSGAGRPAAAAPTHTVPLAGTSTPAARSAPPAATSVVSAPTRTASAAPVRPSPAAAGTAAPASTAADTAAAPRPKSQSQVTLHYSADSWTEVYDSTGARLFYDVGTANSVRSVVGTPPLRVVLGNASGVSVEYNGHTKPIAKLSRPDGSVQFSITRSGEIVRAKPVADGG